MRMIVKLRAVIAGLKPGMDPGAGLMSGVDRHRLYMVIWLVTLPVGCGDRCRGPRNLTAIPAGCLVQIACLRRRIQRRKAVADWLL
jgi:hypothetical protein